MAVVFTHLKPTQRKIIFTLIVPLTCWPKTTYIILILLILQNLWLVPLKNMGILRTWFYLIELYFNVNTTGAFFFAHMPVLFYISLPNLIKLCPPAHCCHLFNASTAGQFSSSSMCNIGSDPGSPACENTEELATRFHSVCVGMLDSITLLKNRRSQTNRWSGLNDVTLCQTGAQEGGA